MVFFALYENNIVNVSDIKSKGLKFKCCDEYCQSDLEYVKSHKNRGFTISSHFRHHKKSDCGIYNFYKNFDEKNKEFYRKWTEPFIYDSIKNTFNSDSKFHVLYDDVMIMTYINIIKPDFIKNKEKYAVNNQKIVWILKVDKEFRPELNKIIKRIYCDDNEEIEIKYYVESKNDYYYDINLFDLNKSDVYLDFDYNKLLKVKNITWQGIEVEPILIKKFFKNYQQIIKPEYKIPSYTKLKIEKSHKIHIDIYKKINQRYQKMIKYQPDFINELKWEKNLDKKLHNKYIQFKQKYKIDYCENIQDDIYENKKYDEYPFKLLEFIWKQKSDDINKLIKQNTCESKSCHCKFNVLKYENHKFFCKTCLKINKEKYNEINDFPEKIFLLDHPYRFYDDIWKQLNDDFLKFWEKKFSKEFCRTCFVKKIKKEKLCCKNCDLYKQIKSDFSIASNYSFEDVKKIFDEHKDNYYDFIKREDNNKKYFCNVCLESSHNNTNFSPCKSCRPKIIYDEIKKNFNEYKKYSYDELCEVFKNNNDNFLLFYRNSFSKDNSCDSCLIKKINKEELLKCETCELNKYKQIKLYYSESNYQFEYLVKIFEEHNDNYYNHLRIIKPTLKEFCNECIQKYYIDSNDSTINCNNCKIISYSRKVYEYIKKTGKINKNLSFEELIEIWKLNNDDFLIRLRLDNPNMCNKCLELKFKDKNYDNKNCMECKLIIN